VEVEKSLVEAETKIILAQATELLLLTKEAISQIEQTQITLDQEQEAKKGRSKANSDLVSSLLLVLDDINLDCPVCLDNVCLDPTIRTAQPTLECP